MPLTQVPNRKHHISGLPEPVSKRKTLAERAGEPNNSNSAAPPSGRTVNGSVSELTTAALARIHDFGVSKSATGNHARGKSATKFSFCPPSPPQPIRRPAPAYGRIPKAAKAKATGGSQTTDGLQEATNVGTQVAPMAKGMPISPFTPSHSRPQFLTRDSNTIAPWDPDEKLASIEQSMTRVLEDFTKQAATREAFHADEKNALRIEMQERTVARDVLYADQMAALKVELQEQATARDVFRDDQMAALKIELQEQAAARDVSRDDQVAALRTELEAQKSARASVESALRLELVTARSHFDRQSDHASVEAARTLRLERENRELKSKLTALRAKVEYLDSGNKAQSEQYASMERQMTAAIAGANEAKEQLRKEESIRRQMHNQIQELKGNIRVFCRVRPTNGDEEASEIPANVKYPEVEESNQIIVRGKQDSSSLGKDTTKVFPFTFDRVFGPTSTNDDIFEDLSQLIQSALDGFNVCVFAYGQTGSGKTYTMSAEDGMIPKALRMIYDNTKTLEERGWSYKMVGSFVEVYNENLNDLLGKSADLDQKKLEIKHDMEKSQTTITNVTTVDLDSIDMVESVLSRAEKNRSVTATKSNERSSRSHSVFMLTLVGENNVTGEKCRGTLNLVDLAGSERVKNSGVSGQALKETQNINKSLSCLGDVIAALGQAKEGGHIPYRNSKLTSLLQFSLGGNSKTLMFCMMSPLMKNVTESVTTLKFAAKVHSTHIGRARKA